MDAVAVVLGFAAAAGALRARLAARRRERGLVVSELRVHPVKGFRGHVVPRALLDDHGLLWDRRWLVVRGEGALFTTQRQIPAMATVHAAVLLPPHLAELASPPAAVVDDGVAVVTLRLTATRSGASLDVPLVTAAQAPSRATDGARVLPLVTVWGKPVTSAVDQGDAVAAWLEAALAKSAPPPPPWNEDAPPSPVPAAEAAAAVEAAAAAAAPEHQGLRLVFFDPSATRRPLVSSHVPPDAPPTLGADVGFADGYPLLLASTASLADLNARLPAGEGPLRMERFRPNIVVSHASDGGASASSSSPPLLQPWAEDAWRRIALLPASTTGGGGGGGVLTSSKSSSSLAPSVSTASLSPLVARGDSDRIRRCKRCSRVKGLSTLCPLPAAGASSPLIFWGVKRCSRCKVTTIDQATGTPHPSVLMPEPLRTLRGFRGDAVASGEVYFGVNLIAEVPLPPPQVQPVAAAAAGDDSPAEAAAAGGDDAPACRCPDGGVDDGDTAVPPAGFVPPRVMGAVAVGDRVRVLECVPIPPL